MENNLPHPISITLQSQWQSGVTKGCWRTTTFWRSHKYLLDLSTGTCSFRSQGEGRSLGPKIILLESSSEKYLFWLRHITANSNINELNNNSCREQLYIFLHFEVTYFLHSQLISEDLVKSKQTNKQTYLKSKTTHKVGYYGGGTNENRTVSNWRPQN